MRAPLTLLLALALGVASAGLVACGAKDNPHLLSPARSDRLGRELDEIQSAVDAHDCQQAQSGARRLLDEVTSLPSDTDPGLRQRLTDGAQNLQGQAAEQCRQTETTPTETTPTETQTTPTETETTPTETQTTPTETTTTPTTTTPTTTTTTTPTETSPESGGSTVPPP